MNIIRKKSFLGAALSYVVYFNDVEIVKIPNGRQVSLDVPADKKFMLTVSILKKDSIMQALTPHPMLSSKKVMIHPEYCKNGVIDCTITTHANLTGSISFGWLRSMMELKVSVNYN